MATCVTIATDNTLVATTTSPDACTDYILQSVSDWQAQQSPLWQLTPEQGAEIAMHMLMVLAIAWVFRMVARFLQTSDGETQND